MKKGFGLLLCLVMLAVCAAALADVAIDAEHFPDEVFRNYVSGFDKDGDGCLSDEELASIDRIIAYNQGIKSLEGVKLLGSLCYLSVSNNEITCLDVSGMTALQELYCTNNQMTSLNVSGCTGLTKLSCYQNELETLDLSSCTALKEAACDRNKLTSLNVSGLAALESLCCGKNQLVTLNLSGLTALTKLECYTNQLASLDASMCGALQSLECASNQLKTLNIKGCKSLSSINCYNNRLTELSLEGCDKIYWIGCEGNRLKNIDVRGKQQIMYLRCDHNDIAVLDLSGCSDRLINMAGKKPKIKKDTGDYIEYLQIPDHDYSGWGTGEQIFIARDTKIVANGTTIYSPPPAIRDCKITGIHNIRYREDVPEPKVQYGDKVLEEGKDYFLKHERENGPGSVGTAWVIVVGMNDYCGLVRAEYTILPQKISKVTVYGLEDRVYTGKTQKPKLSLIYEWDEYIPDDLEEGRDYTVTYKNNKEIGKATVVIQGIGEYYTGTVKKTFNIVPRAVKLTKVKAGKKSLTVQWGKSKDAVTGYQLEYSLKEDFSDSKKLKVKGAGTIKTELKKLESKKTYYIRIRTYKKIGSKTYWSAWSAPKKKTVK